MPDTGETNTDDSAYSQNTENKESNKTAEDLQPVLEDASEATSEDLTEVKTEAVVAGELVKDEPVDIVAARNLIETVAENLKVDERMQSVNESFHDEYLNLLKYLVGEENFNNTEVKNDRELKALLNSYVLDSNKDASNSSKELIEHLNFRKLIIKHLKVTHNINIDSSLFSEREYSMFFYRLKYAARERTVILNRSPDMSDEEKKSAVMAYRANRVLLASRARGEVDDKTFQLQYAKNYSAVYGKEPDSDTVEKALEVIKEILTDNEEEVVEGDPDFEEAVNEVEESIGDTALSIDIDHDSGHAKVHASDEYSFDLKITRDSGSSDFIFFIRDENASGGVVGPFAVGEMAKAIDQRHMDSYLTDKINEISTYNTSIDDVQDEFIVGIASKLLLNADDRGYNFDAKSKDYLDNLAKLIGMKDSEYSDLSLKVEDLDRFLEDESRVNFLRNKLENGDFNSLSELIEEYKVENPSYS